MPNWLLPLIKLAIQIGSPYLLSLINSTVAKLSPAIQEIIQELIDALKNPTASNSAAKKMAVHKINGLVGMGDELK